MWSTVWPGVCTANQSRPPMPDAVAVVHALGRLGRREQHPHGADHHPAPERRALIRRAPRRDRAPRARRRLGLLGVVVHDIGSSLIVGSSSGSTSSACASAAASISARFASPSVSARCGLGPFTVHVENAWCVISSAPVSRAMRPAPPKWSGCECVTTTVCTSLSAVAGRLQPLLQRLPRLRTGQSRVDHGEPAVVDEAVHVHVTETRHPDRQLHAQHAGRDLGDLFRRRLLLLPRRARRLRLRIGHDRQGIEPRVDRVAARSRSTR